MKALDTLAIVMLGALTTGILTGCGYTTASQFDPSIKTVAVPIFQRSQGIYRRGLEMRLTQAVIDRIESETTYKVVKRQHADTILTGTLVQITQRPLSFDPDQNDPRENEITLTVSVTWKRLRGKGEPIQELPNLRASGTYLPSEPFGEEFFQGSEDVINRMALRIVRHMTAPWGAPAAPATNPAAPTRPK